MCHSLSVVQHVIVISFTAVNSAFELWFANSGAMFSRHAFETELSLFHLFWPFCDRAFFDFVTNPKRMISVIERAFLKSYLSIFIKCGLFGPSLLCLTLFCFPLYELSGICFLLPFFCSWIKDSSCSHSFYSIRFGSFDLWDVVLMCANHLRFMSTGRIITIMSRSVDENKLLLSPTFSRTFTKFPTVSTETTKPHYRTAVIVNHFEL